MRVRRSVFAFRERAQTHPAKLPQSLPQTHARSGGRVVSPCSRAHMILGSHFPLDLPFLNPRRADRQAKRSWRAARAGTFSLHLSPYLGPRLTQCPGTLKNY